MLLNHRETTERMETISIMFLGVITIGHNQKTSCGDVAIYVRTNLLENFVSEHHYVKTNLLGKYSLFGDHQLHGHTKISVYCFLEEIDRLQKLKKNSLDVSRLFHVDDYPGFEELGSGIIGGKLII